jgi:hypothetical protein
MSYSTSTPPRLITQGIVGGKIWYYESADAIADVNTSGYFTNGYKLGMRVGDTVIVRDTSTPTTSLCTVTDVSASTGVADVSNGTAIDQTDGD